MESNNLLFFVNSASSNIQEAMEKAPKKKRPITVKKYVENRVKRLDNCRKPRPGPGNLSTKRTSSQQKPTVTRLPPPLQPSNTWPLISASALQSVMDRSACSTSFYPALVSPSSSSPPIDPELESLLSEFECPSVPISRHGSFESVCTRPSCTPPLPTLEAPVYMPEQAFSPYSDYSDELDSAYCSPNGSTQVSYTCSPTSFSSSMPDWCATDLLPPLNTTCMQPESRCNWVSQDASPLTITSTSSVSSLYDDQGPPMTPTVSQLLEQYHPC